MNTKAAVKDPKNDSIFTTRILVFGFVATLAHCAITGGVLIAALGEAMSLSPSGRGALGDALAASPLGTFVAVNLLIALFIAIMLRTLDQVAAKRTIITYIVMTTCAVFFLLALVMGR